jgi:hypothetical protein
LEVEIAAVDLVSVALAVDCLASPTKSLPEAY